MATDRLLSSYTCSFIVIFLFGCLHFVFVTYLFFIMCCVLMLLFCGQLKQLLLHQRAKKVLSDSPRLVDFAIGLVNSVFNLPDRQVMFYEEFE